MFFGGAVGGGKSDFLLGDYAHDVPEYGSSWHGIMFRKSYPQLEELIARSKQIYPAWFGLTMDAWSATQKQWNFPNGATLKMRHAENDDSYVEYQGHAYGWIGFDELPHWSNPSFFQQLKARLRNGDRVIPNKRIRATGNPGGVGHSWIKAHWQIDKYPLGSQLLAPEFEGGNTRMFILSRVTDNKILLANDPGYIARLRDLGSPELVKMYLDGDWNVIAGAFFSEFSTARHVIHPFEIPAGWMRYRAMDWGSASPFCVLWFAIADGSTEHPRGSMICYREWYGSKGGTNPNVGLKLTAEEVAVGIKDREAKGERIDMSVIDPSAAKEDGGPSHISRMAAKKVYFQKADNNRKGGWDMVRARLKGPDPEHRGPPMIYFFTTCPDTIRTLPMLQHDKKKPEDADTDGEDHAPDTVRYACMARPWIKEGTPPKPKPTQFEGAISLINLPTFDEMVALSKKRRLRSEGKT